MIGNFLEESFVFCFPSLLRDPTALHTVEPVHCRACPLVSHAPPFAGGTCHIGGTYQGGADQPQSWQGLRNSVFEPGPAVVTALPQLPRVGPGVDAALGWNPEDLAWSRLDHQPTILFL